MLSCGIGEWGKGRLEKENGGKGEHHGSSEQEGEHDAYRAEEFLGTRRVHCRYCSGTRVEGQGRRLVG